MTWTEFIDQLGRGTHSNNVEFCQWVQEHAEQNGLRIGLRDSGPQVEYRHDSKRFFPFGQFEPYGGVLKGFHWLQYHCDKHGVPDDVWQSYLDDVADLVDGASRGTWISTSGIKRQSILLDGVPELPLNLLASNRVEWFAVIARTIERIAESISGTEIAKDTGPVSQKSVDSNDVSASSRRIFIFSNADESELGFATTSDLTGYLAGGIFSQENGRYRYTLARNADVIVVSRNAQVFGHLEVEERVRPNAGDREAYPKVKWVYLVHTSVLYSNPVPLGDLAKRIRFGKEITELQFEDIQKAGGSSQLFQPEIQVPAASRAQERVLREIQLRLDQGAFRQNLIDAYEGRCAVTGCDIAAALQAAHIWEYADSQWSHVSNGLLLRADIHLLFDRNLLGIDPEARVVSLASSLQTSSYAQLDGMPLCLPKKMSLRPHSKSLEKRWRQFQQSE